MYHRKSGVLPRGDEGLALRSANTFMNVTRSNKKLGTRYTITTSRGRTTRRYLTNTEVVDLRAQGSTVEAIERQVTLVPIEERSNGLGTTIVSRPRAHYASRIRLMPSSWTTHMMQIYRPDGRTSGKAQRHRFPRPEGM